MPRNHRVNFDSLLTQTCSDDPAQRMRTPGCSVRVKEFEPHSRTSKVANVLAKEKPVTAETKFPFKAETKFSFKAETGTAEQSTHLHSTFGVTDRPLKNDTVQLNKSQIENAKLVDVSYNVHEQMDGAEGSAKPFLDGTFKVLNEMNLNGYTLIDSLSTKEYIVVTRGQETKIVFRGRHDDSDNPHVKQVLKGETRDYSELDTLYEKVSKLTKGSNVSVVSYSNGSPKGLYLSEKYNLSHFAIDGLFGPKETGLLINRPPGAAALELLKTTGPGTSSPGIAAAHMALGRDITNSTLTEIQQIKGENLNPLHKFVENHNLWSNYLNTDAERVPSKPSKFNVSSNFTAGFLPGVLANVLVENLNGPDVPHETKLVEAALGTSALTKVVSPLVGAGAASISQTALPVYLGMQAGDKTQQAVHSALPANANVLAKAFLEGGSSGTSAAAAYKLAENAQKIASVHFTTPTGYTAIASEEAALAAEAAAEAAAAEALTAGTVMPAGGTAGGYTAVALTEEAFELAELGTAAARGLATGLALTSETGPFAILGGIFGAAAAVATTAALELAS